MQHVFHMAVNESTRNLSDLGNLVAVFGEGRVSPISAEEQQTYKLISYLIVCGLSAARGTLSAVIYGEFVGGGLNLAVPRGAITHWIPLRKLKVGDDPCIFGTFELSEKTN